MSDRVYLGTRKGLFTLDRAGDGWHVGRAAFYGDPVTIVTVDPRDGAVYAALDHGHFGVKLHKSTDGAETFVEIAAPAYPDKPEGLEDKQSDGRELPWSVSAIWAVTPGHRDRPGQLWCGTIPGGLFRSDDGGATWSLNEPLWNHPLRKEWFGGGADWPAIHSVLVDPRNPDRVIVGVSCGGVWVTEDAGETWACRADGMRADFMPPDLAGVPHVQDPHCVVLCDREPDYLWAQHHCGIWKSTDGAMSWTEVTGVSPSSFGFPVAVHPTDPNTAWFVPAIKDQQRVPVEGQVVVNRTRDGGATFDTLREGLPQTHAYDLVYRHALDVDDTGDRLAFGSTTGAVWVSEDQGDRWTEVSAHLPPVYCLRFA